VLTAFQRTEKGKQGVQPFAQRVASLFCQFSDLIRDRGLLTVQSDRWGWETLRTGMALRAANGRADDNEQDARSGDHFFLEPGP
jgi:hypothetical protein